MSKQIRLRLDLQDIHDLARGKVLFKEETGQSRGTGSAFTAGENPVEIYLTEADRASLQKAIFGAEASTP